MSVNREDQPGTSDHENDHDSDHEHDTSQSMHDDSVNAATAVTQWELET